MILGSWARRIRGMEIIKLPNKCTYGTRKYISVPVVSKVLSSREPGRIFQVRVTFFGPDYLFFESFLFEFGVHLPHTLMKQFINYKLLVYELAVGF